jgi:DNA modification methylase
MTYQLLKGDCLQLLPTLAENSVDAIVTDPPYELGFMGKKWDASGIAYNVELWQQCLRVLKHGGHLLAFGGTRTYHRMACAIEDAGFEIRDSIHWLYGSGFPKSLDVSKAIDKQRDDREQILQVTSWIADKVKKSGRTHADILRAFGFNDGSGMVGHWTARTIGSQPAVPTLEQIPQLLDVLGLTLDDVPEKIKVLLWDLNGRKGQPGENWFKREITGQYNTASAAQKWMANYGQKVDLQAKEKRDNPTTDAAKQWEGWGTALKPAHEPVVVARKRLDGTVANNVLQHGTGALNIDATRANERWPANLIIDETIAEQHPEWANYFYCPKPSKRERNAGLEHLQPKTAGEMTDRKEGSEGLKSPRAGAGRTTGSQNFHPTVKPLALMQYLIRLVTPPEGTVLDPFAGSGTTLAAAILENKNVIGIELTDEYLPIIEARCQWATEQKQQQNDQQQPTLFDESTPR